MRKSYIRNKTISVKHLITDMDDSLTPHMKDRLMDLEVRCVLTRHDVSSKMDIRHVEHTKYPAQGSEEKEFVYGQLLVAEGVLYFTEQCTENNTAMKSPIVDKIYDSLSDDGMIVDDGVNAKKIDDGNIDYIIDSILSVCPAVSQTYVDMMGKYLERH